MGLLDKVMGYAETGKNSSAIQRFLGEGEQVLMAFKFFRDEVVVTNRGIFTIDVQGITGAKKEYKYFPIKGIKYISYESAGSFDMDADIKIGVDGNSTIVNGAQHSVPLSFKIPKAQAAEGESFFKLVKNALDS